MKKRKIRKDTMKYRAAKRVYSEYGRKAAAKKRKFLLNIDEVYRLIYSRCFYCDAPGSNKWKIDWSGSKRHVKYNGIDRINSAKGYTQYNVVPCCITCNRAKSDLSTKKFLNWVKVIFNNMWCIGE
jgi:CRISPR/Cas system CSM-associated protein Csm3 (group 7 of RAMP superfamily)